MTLHVDVRREGEHGIARYTHEVTSRLTVPFRPMTGPPPRLPFDALSLSRARLSPEDWIYSPGYVCSPSRARQVITLHDLIQLRHPGRGGWKYSAFYRHVLLPAIRRAGHVITVSSSSADLIRDWVGPGVTVHDCGNGCSAAFSQDVVAMQRERPYFLMVGNARAHKNIDVALRAVRGLPDVDLVFVSQERAAVRAAADANGLSDRVTVLSGLSDTELARAYAGAVALLFPSLEEGFGLPLVEAAATRCPAIYYAECAASREVCGDAGLPVGTPDDPEQWLAAMTTVLDGRQVSLPDVSGYTWESVGRRVDGVLETLTVG